MRTTLLFVSVALAGCGAIRFDVDEALPEQRIAGNALGGVLPSSLVANPFVLDVDVQAETAKRDTGPASAVLLKGLSFKSTQGSGTFDFLSEARLSIEAPGLTAQEVATLVPVPRGATALDFAIVPEQNLLPYVNAGATLKVTAKGTQPARDFTFDGRVVLEVRI